MNSSRRAEDWFRDAGMSVEVCDVRVYYCKQGRNEVQGI